jgi:hypothetical protein
MELLPPPFHQLEQVAVGAEMVSVNNLWSFEMRGPVILKSDFVCEFNLIKIVLTTEKWF